jgi:hypothetical protein
LRGGRGARDKRAMAGRLVLHRSLRDYAWRCWPDGCPRGRTCCTQLTPEVTRREMRVIDGLMDELVRWQPRLRDAGGWASVFVADDGGYVIEGDERGACPFLFHTRAHARCALHACALATGREVAAVKPQSCRHWPLVTEPTRDGGVRLRVDPAAERVGCVAPRAALPGHPTIAEAFAAEIAALRRRA